MKPHHIKAADNKSLRVGRGLLFFTAASCASGSWGFQRPKSAL